jgi:hypothetical protein
MSKMSQTKYAHPTRTRHKSKMFQSWMDERKIRKVAKLKNERKQKSLDCRF